MQIHELTQRHRVDEVDLVGPGSIFNVGKQVGKQLLSKNFSSLTSSSALGAAQQAAVQQSAAGSAAKLAKQGYQAGGSIKPTVALPQQLQTVRNNPAVQQQVKNLTAQWQKQGAAIVASMQSKTPVSEAAVAISNPETTKDPSERKLLDFIYKQEASKGTAGAQPQTSTPDSSDKAEVNQQLQEFATAFTQWSDPRLAIRGITMDQVRGQAEYNKLLSDQLTKISIQSLANPGSTATAEAISEYFNIAIAAIQTMVNNDEAGTATTRSAAAPAAGTTGAPTDTEILTQLQQQGISVTRAQLEKLGQLMAASSGSNVVRDTGNPVLNAMARLAGMRVTR